MAKWLKFTDVNEDGLVHVGFIDLEKVSSIAIYEGHAEISLGEYCYEVREGFTIQTLERYFTKKSIMIEKLGEPDVL